MIATAAVARVEEALCDAFRSQDWQRADTLSAELDALGPHRAEVTLLSAALWYAEQGLPVFPLQPGQKIPFPRTRGLHEASCDEERIRAWWSAQPEANIAIATGHLVDVVDYDGEQAHVEWGLRYGSSWGGLDVLGTCSTPRPGGLHVYVPASGKGNRAGMVPGVDYRGRGGYVLAPPSRLDNRPGQYPGTYRFLRPLRIQGLPRNADD